MKPNTTLIFVLFITIIMNTSCTHYYYQPNANNVPLFKEKNEVHIQLQASGGNDLSGFDAQTAYAIGKHIGLQFNYFHTGDKNNDNSSGKGDYIEAAAGYFTPLHNNRWVFETYAGIGEGRVTNIYDVSKFSKFGMTKFMVQPSFGYTSKYFNIAVSSKFSLAGYNLVNSSVTRDDYDYDADYIQFLKNKSFPLWEPGIMMRGGTKHFQIMFQVTHSVLFKTGLRLDDTNVSWGIVVPLKITKPVK